VRGGTVGTETSLVAGKISQFVILISRVSGFSCVLLSRVLELCHLPSSGIGIPPIWNRGTIIILRCISSAVIQARATVLPYSYPVPWGA
jgi:hypothetical protein